MFPLKNYHYSIPEGDHPGAFLKERKHHFHEGLDLYAKQGDLVYSIQDGLIVDILNFTGSLANSPWWKNTQAIVIKHKDFFILYGEINVSPDLKIGDKIKEGTILGTVKEVLNPKENKLNPTSMLHIEMYEQYKDIADFTKNDSFNLQDRINYYKILNPTDLLKSLLIEKENVLLLVSGSISAYKSPDIAQALIKSGKNVKVVLSKGADFFVKKEVFEYLGIEVYSSSSDFDSKGVLHIKLARWANRVLIAPASANTISKLANGLCDDLLSTIFISLKDDVLKQILPIMNTEMYNNNIIQENLVKLKNNNCIILKPDSGMLACGEFGIGKLPEIKKLVYLSNLITNHNKKEHIVITAGSTIAPMDPIRFVANSAKGGTGLLLAEKYLKLGYNVTVICNDLLPEFSWLESHPKYKKISVQTTSDLLKSVKNMQFDVYISTMAVSDFEFDISPIKMKKKYLATINPKQAPDVLKYVLENLKNNTNIVVGFAAENPLNHEVIKEKIERKPVDLLIANEADGGFVSGIKKGFGANTGKYIFVSKRGNENYTSDKDTICNKIISTIMEIHQWK